MPRRPFTPEWRMHNNFVEAPPESSLQWSIAPGTSGPATYYGIPELRLDMQAKREDIAGLKWQPWGHRPLRDVVGPWTGYQFYVEDHKFSKTFERPHVLIESGCKIAVEPNYSVWVDTPRAVGLYGVYKKRTLARYWQDRGVKTIVDLNVAPWFAQDNLIGVPHGWCAYSTRGYSDRLDQLNNEYVLACGRAGVSGPGGVLFIVFGGGESVRKMCDELWWFHIPEHMTAVRSEKWRKAAESPVLHLAPNDLG